ncbi:MULTISPECIES: hypothetical protein [unclassified Pseudomonas]|uniref:hypothetical protein n=1 Tax=unclassified Pseudomonas TaxID=196821 RepID=UPI0021C7DBB3|nr:MULTISPECIES: hypothetical protein [unclassified Pseudomonas]MCU1733579.1 hypothetical protein [Pseudomonas sp. 20P_3.2_Bac4]MCU1745843.1 hypothetical protein [Pseudomonas sp. 20P_3.2_Bac5]
MIKTIPMWKMMMVSKGKIVGGLLLACLSGFIVFSVPMFIEGLQNGQTRQAVTALAGLLFFGACAVVLLPSKKYVPGKTFWFYRNKKFSTQMAIKYSYGVIVLVMVVFVALEPKRALHPIGFGLSGLVSLYFLSKSLRFHADVDSSASEYLATALGFSVGEKILVSYQNFDAGEVKAGSNAFAATATKLIVASFDGHVWKKLSRDLSQVSQIGIISNESQSYFVKLQFNDGSDALLSIGLYEKLTSNPILVVRKLLESIDASLLGDRGAPQVSRRSRVVVESGAPVSTSHVAAPETALASTAPTRNIEFTPDMLTALQNAEEVIPGRRLEL